MERMTRAEAARRMGIDKATVTRWVKKHPALLGDDGLVSVGDLERHRAQMVNPALQTRAAQVKADPESRLAASPEPSGPSLNDHRARREQANATAAELDLADRLNQTLARADVEAAVAAAGDTIRQAAGQIARAKAEMVARLDDPRAVERALEEMMRELLATAAEALGAAIAGGKDGAHAA